MNKFLAILNLIASLPVIACTIDHLFLNDEINQADSQMGVIGGSEGPTAIFISYEPNLLSVIIMAFYTGLLVVNFLVLWKSQSTTKRPTEP